MKKIIKNRGIQIGVVLAAIMLLVLLCLLNKYNENIITRARKVLGPKYYNIECINEKCSHVVAYKGDKEGKTTISIINSNGKTVAKYKEDYSKKKGYFKKPVDITKKYIIFALTKADDDTVYSYEITNINCKELLKTKNAVAVITDNYFYEESDDLYTLYDYKGNVIYKDIRDLNFYDNNKIISFNNENSTIINEKSEEILNDYEIIDEVKEDNKSLYLIVKDKNDGYYFYNLQTDKLSEESFNTYVIMSNNKLLISRKSNNEIKKYILDTEGEIEKEVSSKNSLLDELTKKIDKERYEIVEDTIISSDQKGLLVKNNSDNSYGTYDIKTNTYNKLYNFKDLIGDKILTTYSLYEDENNAYLEIGCSLNYCDEENIIVYNPINNNVVFKSNNSKEIKNYRQYDNNYKVLTYTDNTYALLDDNDNELYVSDKDIDILDQKIVFGEVSYSELLLYSVKENKIINNETSLAIVDTNSNYKFYKYSTKENLYLYNYDGDLIRKIPISYSSIAVADKYVLYVQNNKAYIINLMNNKTISYNMTTKEFVEDENYMSINPYKGSIIISNAEKNNIKIVNYNKKVVKNIKNSIVKNVYFDKENNSIFVITKQDNNYGLYILK